jgi:integrase
MKVNDVTLTDTERLCRAVTEAAGPYQANRVGAIGSVLFTAALRWALRSPALGNPFKHLERHKEHHRRRYPKHDELHRLVSELAKHPDRQSANAILLLMYTGARRGEVLGMKWADISLADGTWRRKAGDLKQARDHDVPLSPQALQLLRSIANEQTEKAKTALGEYVFPSVASKSKHLVVIRRLWRNVVKAAELGDLRIHDLRHGFASQLVSAGASLPLIGSLLGHSSPTVTQRYAHLFSEVEREAVAAVGKIIQAASLPPSEPPEPTLSGDVIKIARGCRKPA